VLVRFTKTTQLHTQRPLPKPAKKVRPCKKDVLTSCLPTDWQTLTALNTMLIMSYGCGIQGVGYSRKLCTTPGPWKEPTLAVMGAKTHDKLGYAGYAWINLPIFRS
jgi:hypothetical protein